MNATVEQDSLPAAAEPPVSDVALFRRYTEQGDREALGQLFSRHADQAYRTACRIMRNPTDAEDAVQSAFVRIMRDAARYRGGEGVRMWMIQVVMSACRDAIRRNVRRRRREDESAENMEEPETRDDSVEMGDLVKRLLDVLPERYRMPVWLHHSEGLSFRDVAFAMAVPEGTARSYAMRGIEMLKDRLRRKGIAVPVSALVATLLTLPAEHASAGLMDRVAELAASGADAAASGGASSTSESATALGWKWPAIIGGIVVATGLASVTVLLSPKPAALVAVPPPAVAPTTPAARYHWDLNEPALPPEIKVFGATWTHQASGGVSNSGCIQCPGRLSVFLIDVPMDRLPVVVTYRTSPEWVGGIRGNAGQCKVGWSEYNRAAEFNGLDGPYRIPPAGTEPGDKSWVVHREYITEQFIYRWHDQGVKDLCVFDRAPNARLTLGLVGPHLVDDISIESVQPKDIPDAGPYLAALAAIPTEKRKGAVPLPRFKPGRPDYKQVTVRFDGHFSFQDWVKGSGD